MNYKLILQRLVDFISDLIRIRIVQYLIAFIVLAIIVSIIFSNKPKDIYEEIDQDKNYNEKMFYEQNKITLEDYSAIGEKVYGKIAEIKDRPNNLSDKEKQIKEIVMNFNSNQEIVVQSVVPQMNDEYLVNIGLFKPIGAGDSKNYGECEIRVLYKEGQIGILGVTNYEKKS